MIATSQPLASAAGLKVLQDGGNAIDAAVTAAAVLAVVEPSMTGIGGDLFAIVYDAKTKTLHALNASGRSAYAATPQEYARRGQTRMPGTGVLSVTVPGVVDGWSELLSKYGTLPLAKAVAPAIEYAKNGYAVSEIISGQWKASEKKLAADPVTAATFLPNGHPLQPGEIFANPHLAATLEADRQGRARRVLQGPDRARDRRRHEEARRPARRARLRRSQGRLGAIRFRRTTAATTSTRCRRTRRASSSSRC